MNTPSKNTVGRWDTMSGAGMVWHVVVGGPAAPNAPANVVAAMERMRVLVQVDANGPVPSDGRQRMPFASLRATPEELRELHTLIGQVIEVAEQQRMEVAHG